MGSPERKSYKWLSKDVQKLGAHLLPRHYNILLNSVWVDETGCDCRDHIRKFGYSLKGLPPVYHRLLVRGHRISAIAAMTTEGLLEVELSTGTTSADKFADFVRGSLIPNMQPFDGMNHNSIVIMDNCKIHHSNIVQKLLEDAGILCLYLPPYSPDYNPIEELFSYYLQNHDEVLQSVDNPMDLVHAAFHSVQSKQCVGWVHDSGYM